MSINTSQSFRTLQGATQIVAQAFAQQAGIKVIFGKYATAYIQLNKAGKKEIHLPSLPPNLEDAKVLTFGFLTHEIAHENYTDFSVDFPKHPSKVSMFQVLEDVRIEILSSARYPGSAINLKRLLQHLVNNNNFFPFRTGLSPSQLMVGYTSTVLRANLLGQGTFDLSQQYENDLANSISVGAKTKLDALIYTIGDCKNTADVKQLVEQIFDMLKDEKQELNKPQQPSNDQSKQGQNSQSGSSGQSQSSQSENGQDKNQNSGSQGQGQSEGQNSNEESQNGSSGQNAQSDSSNQSGAQGQGNQQGDQSNGDDSSNGQGPQGQNDGSNQQNGNGAGGQLSSNIDSILSGKDSVGESDLGAIVSQQLNELSNDPLNQRSAVDPMLKKSLGVGVDSSLLAEVRAASNATKIRVLSLLEAQSRVKKIHSNTGVKLDQKRVSRIVSGQFDVFTKKIVTVAQNTAIQILIDISGSMSHEDRYKLALRSGLSVALALEQAKGVDVAVSAFPFADKVLQLTSFGERTSGSSNRYSQAKPNGGTPMSEAIMTASFDLLSQNNDRKIFLVITDGQPDNVDSCKQVIDSISDMGVEFIGLGIGTSLPAFFKTSKSIAKIDELPSNMFELLKQKLMDRRFN